MQNHRQANIIEETHPRQNRSDGCGPVSSQGINRPQGTGPQQHQGDPSRYRRAEEVTAQSPDRYLRYSSVLGFTHWENKGVGSRFWITTIAARTDLVS